MSAPSISLPFDPARRRAIADGFVVALAVALPWSTSAVSILLVFWVIALLPVLDWAELRRTALSPVGGLPLLLVALGIIGMAWANVNLHERWEGLTGFLRLIAIPLLIVQVARSEQGSRVLLWFLFSCTALLVASAIWWLFPELPTGSNSIGVPVKSYIIQSLEFTVCAAGLADFAVEKARRGAWLQCFGVAALALAFLADIVFIATGRTALAVIPVLVVLYGFHRAGWRGLLAGAAGMIVVAAAVWMASPYLRERVIGVYTEASQFEKNNAKTSAGERIAFWTKSVRFIETAPLIGHGTGSITTLFERAATGQPGPRGEVSSNPHNQTMAVGIQLGIMGVLVLWAMWAAQLAFFFRPGLTAWIGLVIVVSNVIGSLFNSLIFDFTEGWLYVLGVGIVAGMVKREQARRKAEGIAA